LWPCPSMIQKENDCAFEKGTFIMNRKISPFNTGMAPEEVRRMNAREEALTYRCEKRQSRIFITDLSHIAKWALHKKDMDAARPFGIQAPEKPGRVAMQGSRLVIRLAPAECLILVLNGETPDIEDADYTDMTDGYAAFALVGSECFELLRKLSPVDLEAPEQVIPCGTQAPIHDVRCVIVRLEGAEGVPGLIILGERGYGRFLSDIVLDAGEEFGLSPAGWRRFELWLKE
jgi:sarcosine oxidase gamma subunit